MKKYILLIGVLFVLAAPAQAQTRLTVGCSGTWVTLADGSQSCNTAATGGTGSGGTTAQSNGNLGYTPLEPIPGVTTGTGSYDPTAPGSLPGIINAIFNLLITAGALLAVLSLTIGGVQYMTSGSGSGKNNGIARAKAALWGILLIATTWLILNTVNPQLLKFNLNPCERGCSAASTSNFNPNGAVPVTIPSAPAANVSTLSQAQVQNGQTNGDISGKLVNIPNNTFTWTLGAPPADINAPYAAFANACKAANGSIQSGPTSNNGRTASEVCVQQ